MDEFEILDFCRQSCEKEPGTVVFPDSLDLRVLEAAKELQNRKLAKVFLVNSPFAVRDKIRAEKIQEVGFNIFDPGSPDLLSRNTEEYIGLAREKGKKLDYREAEKIMSCPVAAAAMMVRRKEADISVAGNLSSTAEVLKAGLTILPKIKDIKTISSFFFMISPDRKRKFVFADCAVVPEPTPEALADIAIMSAEKARNLLQQEPRVALLSFSTKGSSKHPRARTVRDALEIIRTRAPDIAVDGELQFDAAHVQDVAALKAPGSIIEGRANVFIFPSLEAGNIAYKMVERLAGYSAIGPFIQGFQGGWHDLSRGCSSLDVFNVALIGICLQRGNLLN